MNLLLSILITCLTLNALAFSNKNIIQIQKTNGKIILEIDPSATSDIKNLDIIFVVDDSGSMQAYQDAFSKGIPTIAAKLEQLHVDTNAAVITTTNESSYDSIGAGGRFVGGKFFNSKDTDFVQNLSKAIGVGTAGSATEQPLGTLFLALSEPLISNENSGFLRKNAALQIVFITDAEDHSTVNIADLERHLINLKGDAIYVSGGIVPSQDAYGCPMDGQEKPIRLEQFINDFKGQILSLCSATFANDLKIYESALLEFDRNIILPTKAKFETIKVQFGQTDLFAGDVLNGWLFDSSANKLTIGSQVDLQSPVGAKLRIEYVPIDWQ